MWLVLWWQWAKSWICTLAPPLVSLVTWGVKPGPLCPHVFSGDGHMLSQEEFVVSVGLRPHQGHVFSVAA